MSVPGWSSGQTLAAGAREGCPVKAAAPRPGAERVAEPCPHGILEDVAAELGVIALVLDEPRGVAAGPQRAEPIPARVEALRVDAVQVLHPARQVWERRHDDEVVVRRHQTVRVQPPAEASSGAVEQRDEPPAVVVVGDDGAACDSTGPDVIVSVRVLDTEWTRHGRDRSSRYDGEQAPAEYRHDRDPIA